MRPLDRRHRFDLSSLRALIPLATLGVFVAGCQGTDSSLAPAGGERQAAVAGAGDAIQGKIAFHSTRDGQFEIYAMNADGSEQTNLTNSADEELEPAWSPDGRHVAFCRFPAGFSGPPQLWVMNADGTGARQLTNDPNGICVGVWSPGGGRIAFVSERNGDREIYTMRTDGSDVRQVTTGAYVVSPTAWSPDGKQIAFITYRDYIFDPVGDLEIAAVKVADGSVTRLTNNTVDDEGDHAGWSPNGRLFTFSSHRDGGDLDIFVMNADGSNVRQVTGVGGDGFVDDDDSSFSPDGRSLTFQSTRDGDEEVYTARIDGSDVRQLTFNVDMFDAVATWAAGRVRGH